MYDIYILHTNIHIYIHSHRTLSRVSKGGLVSSVSKSVRHIPGTRTRHRSLPGPVCAPNKGIRTAVICGWATASTVQISTANSRSMATNGNDVCMCVCMYVLCVFIVCMYVCVYVCM